MQKNRTRTCYWKHLSLLLLAVLSLAVPLNAAFANSAPPPSIVWLTFEYQATPPPQLIGLQLIRCQTALCDAPILLHQDGVCDQAECVPFSINVLERPSAFGCAANKCRSLAYPTHGGTDFKLVGQFSDRLRSSAVVSKLPSQYGEVSAWRVLVTDTTLIIKPDSEKPITRSPLALLLENFGRVILSILMELVVAGLCFQLWARTELRQLIGRLWIIFLVNLVSLPVVWLTFPALGQFQPAGSRSFGYFILFISLVYSALFAGIYRTKEKTQGWIILITLGSLPLSFICLLADALIFSYADSSSVIVQGWPAGMTILASEVFAVVFEALLITLLSNRSLKPKLIWLTSLAMNLVSYLIGQWLIGHQFPF